MSIWPFCLFITALGWWDASYSCRREQITFFCDGLKYVQKNFAEYKVSVFVGVPLLVENLYYKVMKQIEKQKERPRL